MSITFKKTPITHVYLVLDDSGSMFQIAAKTKDAFNRTLADIKAAAARTSQDTRVTLTLFGETISTVFREKSAAEAPTLETFNPAQGHTRLFDTVGQAIEEMEALRRTAPDDAFLLMVLTDGHDNLRTKYSEQVIRDLIARVQGTDRYTLTFLLPPGNKRSFCSMYSIPEGNVAEWEQTAKGVEDGAVLRSRGLTEYFTAREQGKTSVQSFYVQTDTSKLTATQVARKLDDITPKVKVWEVGKEEAIKEFCERKNRGTYDKGAGFYQLTKKEKAVQPHKKVILIEKGKETVFGGDEARRMIGLPDGANAAVDPGNHGRWDIFIQSTSGNRKLVRGTKVIYFPEAAKGAVVEHPY